MIHGIRLKICGLTSLIDAELADRVGADFLGFVLYPQSPRGMTVTQYRTIAPRLPDRQKVAVLVEPTEPELAEAAAAGFDRFQIHFRHDLAVGRVAGWAKAVGPERLWLAPKLPSGSEVPAALLPLAGTFLLDTVRSELFGGSGRTGDWMTLRRHREAHPDKAWILSGGLTADNIGAALAATGAQWVDVNSGVEAAPGVKDPAKVQEFVTCLRNAAPAH
jgi:phosphoribosylanthranilate isomerase